MDHQGGLFSWDAFLDLLESAELAFDDDGNLTTQAWTSRDVIELLQSIERTPEQKLRFREIMLWKKEAWDAQQRPRRLPRRDQGTGV